MSSADESRWSDLVRVRPRYQRSVNLVRDAEAGTSLDGYVVTPLVRSLVRRIGAGLKPDSQARAWSLTGPYGTGKSAFALFLAELLSCESTAMVRGARQMLAEHDTEAHDAIFGGGGSLADSIGLLPVLAGGRRQPLEVILLEALARSVDQFWSGPGARPNEARAVADALKELEQGSPPDSRRIVELFEAVAAAVARSRQPGRGLLVILDEAGKPLEYAANTSGRSDIHVLQELAEAAGRSGDTPIVFAVLLHQGFEHYATRLGSAQRNEWSKVQGRFEDLPFRESEDQLLRLLAAALDVSELPAASRRAVDRAVSKVRDALGESGVTAEDDTVALLSQTAPLHPLTALTIGALFRSRLAQNERSLFAFLGASEPGGFQDFLKQPWPGSKPSLYHVFEFYDYVQSSLGSHLYGVQGRQWVMVEEALRRLPVGSTEVDVNVLKAIGVLTTVSDATGIPASHSVLLSAFAGAQGVSRKAVDDALERLQAASIVVFRKFRNSYQLWEGSDIDLGALVAQGLRENGEGNAGLLKRLNRVAPPRPIVARRHLARTGTLRYFDVRYTDESVTSALHGDPDEVADGVLWLAISSNEQAANWLPVELVQPTGLFKDEPQRKPAVVAVPVNASYLRQLAAELAGLEWVRTNTPTLRDDAVARRELSLRVADAESLLRDELHGLLTGRTPCRWFFNSVERRIDSPRDLSQWISTLCDDTYSQAPTIHNELLNREQLSSSAASARRELLVDMVNRSETERLGLDGFPPAYSMYRSLLEVHGLHRKQAGSYGFHPPRKLPEGSLTAVWERMQQMLADSEAQRLPLRKVYDVLSRPPYGVRMGVLPVVVVAAIMEARQEVAIYEDGAFLPALDGPEIERLVRSPDRFALQRYIVAGPRKMLVTEMVDELSISGGEPTVLGIVRMLVRLTTNLPGFTRNTRRLLDSTKRVREVLLRAKEPAPLLFVQLPAALGYDTVPSQGSVKRKQLRDYAKDLRAALKELSLAYELLLSEFAERLADSFSLASDLPLLRSELVERARGILPKTADVSLKSFLIRVLSEQMSDAEWLESVATVLAGKPPKNWHDTDFDQAQLSLADIRRRFDNVEALHLAETDSTLASGTALIRVCIAQTGASEHERIVSVRQSDQTALDALCDQLRSAIGQDKSLRPDTLLAGLAIVTRDLIEATDRKREALAHD